MTGRDLSLHYCIFLFIFKKRPRLQKVIRAKVTTVVIRLGFEPRTPSLKGMCSTY